MIKLKVGLLICIAAFSVSTTATASNTFPSSGNVGIGTTSPSDILQVETGGAATILLGNTSTGDTSLQLTISGNSGGYSSIQSVQSSGSAWGSLNLNASGGNVGIGTTSPGALLDVGNPGTTLGTMRLDGSSSGYVQIQPAAAAGSWTMTLPSSAGTNGYVLETNGSGTTSWTSVSGGIASSAGQLQCSGGNCNNSTGSGGIQYCPYKGNVKTTASQGNYTLPAACLTATLTSMYVDGVGSSSVSANTLYYIYLWNDSGTWVLDAETTGHATDSSSGLEIMSGDDTKTLVGMIHTDANMHVMSGGETNTPGDTNTVATWDNRRSTTTTCHAAAAVSLTNTGPAAELDSTDRCLFMSWGDSLQFSSQKTVIPASSAGSFFDILVFLDSVVPANIVAQSQLGAQYGWYMPILFSASFTPSEGFHTSLIYGIIDASPYTLDVEPQNNTFQTVQ